ncbi:ester cyclase [Chitinophaga oryziterrae]|uniref:Ester cyclase n=1 Tax=Chitinophaga oryziterrae TaxID=1031224 RepID=A0A6N8JAU8_9BACT|nr:ester cyclase [Chitinophaga oryziterrae]MVT41598.1 ester cyclase [Chitinophaga oryziterrae]
MNQTDLEKNKTVIARFDKACIEKNDKKALDELVADHVINHAARQGASNGKESFHHFLQLLHSGLSDIKVEILQQVAEKDLVVTRKSISGMHTGNFMGVPPTGKAISIEAIEIIRLENGKYAEHWVQSNLRELLSSLN